MRPVVLLSLVASMVALAPAVGAAKECPASPLKASTAIWPFGAIRTGQSKTGRHPCGRQITCIGGKFEPKILRECHWD